MSSCPDDAALRTYESGAMPDAEADALATHVSTCRDCGDVLNRLRAEDFDARVIRAGLKEQLSTVSGGATSPVPTADGESDRSNAWNVPDYERVRLCGTGAYGAVWVARDRVGQYRALKTIDLGRLHAAGLQCRESTALEVYCRRVERHRNLIEIYHVGMAGDTLYYTMELADDDITRGTIRDRLPENYHPLTLERVIARGPVTVDTAVEVAMRLLSGLSHLHETGLAHRDIKPANIVFVDRQPKLADIGMITSNRRTPSQVGTPEYMPPDGTMDLTADTFAMGKVLYELAAGPDDDRFPELPDTVVDCTAKWDMAKIGDVLSKACSADAASRYATAGDMLKDLEACRELSYEFLLSEIAATDRESPVDVADRAVVPIIIAAINALPWLAFAAVALVLVKRLL